VMITASDDVQRRASEAAQDDSSEAIAHKPAPLAGPYHRGSACVQKTHA
jgi:hypothetical protein